MTPPPFRRAEEKKRKSEEEQVMVEFAKPGFDPSRIEEVKPSDIAMGFAHQESDSYVALDIGALSLLAGSDKDFAAIPRLAMQKTLSRKGSQRGGGGGERKAVEGDDNAHASTGGAVAGEKTALLVHVASEAESVGLPHATTPTAAGGGRWRRLGRRSSPWLDPRRVLVFFATLSSMGTLILLYFTLSMGKMAGGDANVR